MRLGRVSAAYMSTWPRANGPIGVIVLSKSPCPERGEILSVGQLRIAIAAGDPNKENKVV